ncbi:ATP-binding protein [Paenibacillus sp. GSMTC-2017]|uniref:sensor histidine kinase n=1 Tax=Paenibacillus sp. GSMTC-2017 TaxID=2794350 RepID=UPI0018D81BE6|nr:HAMP domain-containing sensor histidine kinase [Paenibacillus sp. GSMTC-2017]MBH5319998.1 ATP-binding protein [Paenibacillus sp. GSMTC-2017]
MIKKRSVSQRFFLLLLCFIGVVLWTQSAHAESTDKPLKITEWQMLWEEQGKESTITEVSALSNDKRWFSVKAGEEYPALPEGVSVAWIKFQLPEMTQKRPALEFNKLYARNVVMYLDNEVMYERYRDYYFDQNEMVIPVSESESFKIIYVKLQLNSDRLGMYQEVKIGEYDTLLRQFIKKDLLDVVVGASLIFISLFMMVSVGFLNRSFQPGWNSLLLMMLSIGIMILTYSPFLDKYFPEFGTLFLILFELASCFLIPSLFFFLEKVFGKGPFSLISRFKKIQFYLAPFQIIMLILSYNFEPVANLYGGFGYYSLGLSIIIGNVLLISTLIYEFASRNKDARILSIGISIFAGVGLVEIIYYFYSDAMYRLYYWKISILFFLASLIIILVRRVMYNYKLAVEYSNQIEIYNDELQRTEKIELISNLAASIAHEVRNPLQVTRGFLQLLGNKAIGTNDKSYIKLAIDELDRASEIITDFLTFSKPDLGGVMKLNTLDEIQQVVAILSPLASMQGGALKIIPEEKLFMKGNSSRFKQALINIIKNSIEAFREDGEVIIKVFREEESSRIVIHIADNGEGIDEHDLKRLGEPYYSKKTKGTGLGLMVTYRIIEAMNGEIRFYSTRGAGTEVFIKIPEAI